MCVCVCVRACFCPSAESAEAKLTHLLTEVLINDLVGKVVNVSVSMMLQILNLLQSICLLDLSGNHCHIWAGQLQNVSQPIQNNLSCLQVVYGVAYEGGG